MKSVSTAEIKILKIVWKKGTTTFREITEELSSYKWTRTTIGTLIQRLYKKGILKIVGKEGKSFIYESCISEKQFQKMKTEELLNLLFDEKIENLIEIYKK